MLAIALLLLSGCESTRDNPMTEKQFRTGTDGLEMEFLPNAPPESISEDTLFKVIAKVHNIGAYEITNALFTISLEKDYMCQTLGGDECSPDALPTTTVGIITGRSLYYPNGDYATVEIDVKTKEIDALSEKHKSTVVLTGCYEYATELGEDVCIDTDVYNLRGMTKVCEASDIDLTGQGAPVAITKVETKMLAAGSDRIKPQFTIYIENKGDGNVITSGKIAEACSSAGLARQDWNAVNLDRMSIAYNYYDYINGNEGDSEFECKRQPIKLTEDAGKLVGQVVCTLKDEYAIPNNGPAFTTQLYALLKYGYTHSISADVVIEREFGY